MIRTCSCGAAHDWSALPLIGVQRFDDATFELRNCGGCGSTLAEPVADPLEAPLASVGGHAAGGSHKRLGFWARTAR